MLVTGYVGFYFLISASLLCSAFVLRFRRKWRFNMARDEEINRLLIMASEEVSRAEMESSVPLYLKSQCALCFLTTKKLCSRCKAVYYCSGKCQIIHWRQGHKDHCRPPSTDYDNNDGGNNFSQKVKQENCDMYEPESRGIMKPFEKSFVKHALCNSTSSLDFQARGNDDKKVDFCVDLTGKRIITKSPFASVVSRLVLSDPFIGPRHDAFDRDMSCSNHPERSHGHHKCVDATSEKLETSNSKRKYQTDSVVPECTILADSLDSMTFTGSGVLEPHSGSTTSSDSHRVGSDGGLCPNRPTFSYSLHKENASSDEKPNLWAESDHNSFEPKAFTNFSFNLSGNFVQTSLLHGSETKNASSLVIKKPIDRVTLSENNITGGAKVKDFAYLSYDRYNRSESDPIRDSHVLKFKEVSSVSNSENWVHTSSSTRGISNTTGTSRVINSPNLNSKKSTDVDRNISSNSYLLEFREAGALFTDATNVHLPSNTGKYVVPNGKFGNVDDHTGATISRYPPNISNGLKTSVLKIVDHVRPSKLLVQHPMTTGSDISKKYYNKGLFRYDLFVKLYNMKKVEMQPCGLTNCGNSCYANVVLQCLAFTPPLIAYFLQGLHSRACGKREWCFTCEFERLILKTREGKLPLSPIGILSNIGKISSNLGNGKQEDAHEFLRYAIDTMQSICFKEAGMTGSRPFGEETTLIGLTFGGYLRSKIKCMKCHGKSERREHMMDLTVEIEGDIGSLEEALRNFTGTEILDGENKYQCSRCKSYEKAKKKITILEAPNVLTIALKRFQSGKFGKLNKSIQFPEILNMAPYMSGTSDKSPVYSLYGVVVHLDVMNAAFSGHYVCYVKNAQNKWFKIDDSIVKAVDRETILTKGAYMLLYARCSPRAPKSLRSPIIAPNGSIKAPHTDRTSSNTSLHPMRIPSDDLANVDSRIFDRDSSSENSSIISGSDEGTENSRDSTSTSDFSDYIFGDSGLGLNSPYRVSSDSDASSSSPILFPRRSSLADLDRYASCSPKASVTNMQEGQGKGRNDVYLYSDSMSQFRNIGSNNSSSYKETDSGSLDRIIPQNIKSSLSLRH